MISLSMISADTNGFLVFDEDKADIYDLDTRVSRQATLDGGCVIVNSGLWDSDRTLDITANFSEVQRETIEYIQRNAVYVHFSCVEGFFLGAISKSTRTKLTVLIKSKEV